MMLAAGRPEGPVGSMLVCRELGLLATEIGRLHRARGELDRAREIEIHVRGELERVRAGLEASRPASAELDAESKTARQATKPLDLGKREPPDQAADMEAVKRLSDSTRRRGPRRR